MGKYRQLVLEYCIQLDGNIMRCMGGENQSRTCVIVGRISNNQFEQNKCNVMVNHCYCRIVRY